MGRAAMYDPVHATNVMFRMCAMRRHRNSKPMANECTRVVSSLFRYEPEERTHKVNETECQCRVLYDVYV